MLLVSVAEGYQIWLGSEFSLAISIPVSRSSLEDMLNLSPPQPLYTVTSHSWFLLTIKRIMFIMVTFCFDLIAQKPKLYLRSYLCIILIWFLLRFSYDFTSMRSIISNCDKYWQYLHRVYTIDNTYVISFKVLCKEEFLHPVCFNLRDTVYQNLAKQREFLNSLY